MRSWQNNNHVLYHLTTPDALDSILKNGIMSIGERYRREKIPPSVVIRSPIYCDSKQDREDISFYSAGGDYLDFANQRNLTEKAVREMTEKEFEDMYISLNGCFEFPHNGKRLLYFEGTAEAMKDSLLYAFQGNDPLHRFLLGSLVIGKEKRILLVVGTKKVRRVFPHRFMYPQEVCIRERIEPSEIIDVLRADDVVTINNVEYLKG